MACGQFKVILTTEDKRNGKTLTTFWICDIDEYVVRLASDWNDFGLHDCHIIVDIDHLKMASGYYASLLIKNTDINLKIN